MKLSVPVFRLRRNAKNLARRENISLSRALDRIATAEGFGSWNLLAAFHRRTSPSKRLLDLLQPGEMLLLAARPGHGKTRLGLELLDDASRQGLRAVLFSSEISERDMAGFCPEVGNNRRERNRIEPVLSDELCVGTVTASLSGDRGGPIAVVDYLQVLDQRRASPELSEQIKTLKAFAGASGARLVVLSQVHRSYDPARKPLPDWSDVRLPNPVDLSLFDRGCFLNDGKLAVCPSP